MRSDLIQQADNPGSFMIYEAYESEDAAAHHKTTAHYMLRRDTVADFMSEPRKGVRYIIIEPKDSSQW